MLFRYLALAALAGSTCADWVIETLQFTAKDSSQLDSMTKAYGSEVSKYYATLTKDPEWTKAVDVLRAYQQTGKGVPAAITATNTVVTFTTTPAWYAAMPTQAKNVFDGVQKKEEEIVKKIQSDADKKNGAARPSSMGIYVGSALVAAVAGVAAVL